MKIILLAVAIFISSLISTRAADSSGVIQIDQAKMAAAFAKGGMLIQTNNYKVMAGRRDAPGVPHQFTAVNGPFLYFVVKVSR